MEEMAVMEAQDLVHRQEVTGVMAATEETEAAEVLQAQETMEEVVETGAMEEMEAMLALEEMVAMEAMVETEEMEAMAVLEQLAPTHPHPPLLLATSSLRSAMVRSKHLLETLNPSPRSQTVRFRLLLDLVFLKVLRQLLLLAILLSRCLALDASSQLQHHPVVL
jgi:hypothetical protein